MTYSSEFPHTFLSLERYASILGLDPLQFFGAQSSISNVHACDDVWFQYGYQDGGKISREELRQAISQAESDLIAQVGYFPAPHWTVETVDYPQYRMREWRGVYGYQSGGFNYKTVQTSNKYVIQGGSRATTQIDSANITRDSDIDTTGDSFNDTAVFTIINIDFTDICELQAYFKVFDVADVTNTRTDPGSSGADRYWQIRPIRATLSGTTATVYISIHLLLKPQLQRRINADVIDADSADSYVDTIEFYRVYNDPETQAIFLWSNEKVCNSTACAWATQNGCIRVRDHRRGLITPQPATYNADSETFSTSVFAENIEPNRVILSYQSGFQDPNARNCDELSYFWAWNIAVLATARLNKQVCACENVARRVAAWQEDMAMATEVRTYNINFADISNPFGTQRGAIDVWNRIKNRGIKVGQNIQMY